METGVTEPALRILHLEDDPLDSRLVVEHLRKGGLQVEVDRVGTPDAFRQAIARDCYSLVLSDYTIPGVRVEELLRLAKQTCPEVPFVFFSGTIREELGIEMLKQGASDYVLKQRPERLVPAVQRAMQEHAEYVRRRRAEEALRKSERRLRATFDHAGVGIVEVSGNDQLTAVNDRACRIFGRPREDLLGMDVRTLTWPEDRARSDEMNALVHSGQQDCVDYEKRYIRGDGSPVWVHVTVAAVRDEQGDWIHSITTIEDISERKQAEQSLRRSELQFRELADAMPQIVWAARAEGTPDYVNRRWYELGGAPEGIAGGERWLAAVHPDDRQRSANTWNEAVRTGKPYEIEYRLKFSDRGEYRWYLGRALPVRDEQGTIIRWYGTCTDVHELKQIHEELASARHSAERAKAAAEEASRAKDHFLAVLSHELRTPLAPVLAAVSMLQEGSTEEASAGETLEMIRRNIEMEARLIDDLLDVTRIVRGKIELDRHPTPLGLIVHQAVEVCRQDMETRQIEFGMHMDHCGDHLLDADPARMQQVFWNLLKNAVKFTPHGGCIGVRCWREGAQVVAEVADSGEGIEPHVLPHIFNAFEQGGARVTRQFGGLGLGLTITKGVVELHGGTIEAHSDGKGRGARFRVRMPICEACIMPEPSSPTAAQHAATAQDGDPGQFRIVLVEDHGDTARVMRRLLTSRGYHVETAADVSTAMKLIEEHPFDLLLSDLGLPDGSGIDLMRALRERGSSMPGIALSGYGQDEDIRRSKDAGFAAHLTKPTNPDLLTRTIRAVAGLHAK